MQGYTQSAIMEYLSRGNVLAALLIYNEFIEQQITNLQEQINELKTKIKENSKEN